MGTVNLIGTFFLWAVFYKRNTHTYVVGQTTKVEKIPDGYCGMWGVSNNWLKVNERDSRLSQNLLSIRLNNEHWAKMIHYHGRIMHLHLSFDSAYLRKRIFTLSLLSNNLKKY